MNPTIYVGDDARARAHTFRFRHWASIVQWREYHDGMIVAGLHVDQDGNRPMGWEIVREPQSAIEAREE